MVLTNLFRDQLDRYGEIDITMNLLKKAMQMAPDMTVIVNGDDALSAYLAMESGNPYVTYGIDVYKRQDDFWIWSCVSSIQFICFISRIIISCSYSGTVF